MMFYFIFLITSLCALFFAWKVYLYRARQKLELETIIDTVPAIIVHKDLEGRVLKVNRLAKELTNDLFSNLIGRRTADVFHDLKERIEHEDQSVISTGKPLLNLTYTFFDQKGKQRWLGAHKIPYFDQNGKIIGTIFLGQDITVQKKFEEKLKQQKELFQLAIQGTRDGLWDWPDMGEDKQYWSPRMKELLDYGPSEIEGSNALFFSLLHPEDLPLLEGVKERHIEKNEPFSVEIRLKKKTGEWGWFEMKGEIVLSKGKGRMSGLLSDISKRKQVEEELKNSNERLKLAIQDLEDFTSMTSHNLRTPLINIQGFATRIAKALEKLKPLTEKASSALLGEEKKLFDEVLLETIPKSLYYIEGGVKKIEQMTNGILSLSKLGKREIRREIQDPRPLIEKCLQQLAHEIEEKNVEVILSPLPKIFADKMALEQIFSLLLENSVKYLSSKRRGKIEVGGELQDEETILWIKDNGRGILPEDRDKVFAIFSRGQNVEEISGDGMGLSYVRSILHRHNGEIFFESHPDRETTFFLSFPNKKFD